MHVNPGWCGVAAVQELDALPSRDGKNKVAESVTTMGAEYPGPDREGEMAAHHNLREAIVFEGGSRKTT